MHDLKGSASASTTQNIFDGAKINNKKISS